MKRRDALKQTTLIFGYTVTAGSLGSILSGCKQSANAKWNSSIFGEDEVKSLSKIVDLMLPATDTPGALELGIDQFVDQCVTRIFNKEDQEQLAKDLVSFNQTCKEDYGNIVADCSAENQHKIMAALEKSITEVPPSFWGQSIDENAVIPFYSHIKELTLLGYFTSERIGKEELSHLPIPGEYLGCIPLSEVGNNWSE